jgi:hypothetical protein
MHAKIFPVFSQMSYLAYVPYFRNKPELILYLDESYHIVSLDTKLKNPNFSLHNFFDVNRPNQIGSYM